ncbi:MAG TPA: prepilin-type N-terminal cleavage/methylation domain-containing protein [Desulfobacterales bacterium]|nr:prepilin-type N-terminal cleavage/methylation domain-containing protein [Desulfobacterales bacterium]
MIKILTGNQTRTLRRSQPETRNPQSKAGFTLLEIMVAISIMAIVLVTVFRMHAQTLSMTYSARFYATSPLLAQKKMVEIESIGQQDMTDDSGDFGDEFPGYRWRVAVDDVESKALGGVAENLKKIDILVTLNNDEFTYSVRTYKFLQD